MRAAAEDAPGGARAALELGARVAAARDDGTWTAAAMRAAAEDATPAVGAALELGALAAAARDDGTWTAAAMRAAAEDAPGGARAALELGARVADARAANTWGAAAMRAAALGAPGIARAQMLQRAAALELLAGVLIYYAVDGVRPDGVCERIVVGPVDAARFLVAIRYLERFHAGDDMFFEFRRLGFVKAGLGGARPAGSLTVLLGSEWCGNCESIVVGDARRKNNRNFARHQASAKCQSGAHLSGFDLVI
jgi:hypothetical protein